MNILVIGASGRVGNKLVKGLLEDGHQVTGTSRKTDKLFDVPNYKQITLEVTDSLTEIEKAIPDETEAIYFVSGSTGKNVLQVDLHGAVKTMQAAESKNIKRYVLLSGIYSLEPDKWTSIIDYYTGKYFADLYLMNQTGLDYTILQPGHLTETEGSGKITLDESQMNIEGKNSIQNVADTLKEVLDKPNTFKKSIPMLDGDVLIANAISNF